MFAYCNNNPGKYYDADGREPVTISVTVAGVVIIFLLIPLLEWALRGFLGALQELITRWQYAQVEISYTKEETEETLATEETLPHQGLVKGNPEAPPVDAGKQGKHVPGHNNYNEDKSSWPKGQNGVAQTQEAWQNGKPDQKVPSGKVRIGVSSDGTVVRVHIDGKGAIHGYPLFP